MNLFFLLCLITSQVCEKCVSPFFGLNTNNTLRSRQLEIRNTFLRAYNAYEKCCFGHDEIRPVSNLPRDYYGFGLTIIDSLDMMYILGCKEEIKRAREHVKNLVFDSTHTVSFFETVIRVVGGLLGAYELSKDELYLEKAKEVSDILIDHGFSGNGFPYPLFNFKKKQGSKKGNNVYFSEVLTNSLEWNYLSKHTNDCKYKIVADNLIKKVKKYSLQKTGYEEFSGLFPNYMNINGKAFTMIVSLGALGDSGYEYFIKSAILTDEYLYYNLYRNFISGLNKITDRSVKDELLYLFEVNAEKKTNIIRKMDHLACFLPGTIAHGAYIFRKNKTYDEEIQISIDLLKTCIEFYERTETGISPEIVHFHEKSIFGRNNKDFFINDRDSHYLLRPETVESLFYLYRITHDEYYREIGWKIYKNIVKYSETKFAYSGIRSVKTKKVVHDDVMESFFLTETLKYLYLLFAPDDFLSLDEYVFTTEGHPLKQFKKYFEQECYT